MARVTGSPSFRRAPALLAALALAGACVTSSPGPRPVEATPAAPAAPVALKIIAVNDLHGQLASGQHVGKAAVGGAGVLAAHLRSAGASAPNTLLVEAGDLVGASPADSALLQDEPTVAFLNLFANARCLEAVLDPGCNVVGVPGNHEFDEGVDELLRLLRGGNHAKGPFLQDPWRGARFPVVSANVRRADGALLFPPHVVKVVGGVKVAFIGATIRSTASMAVAPGVAELTFGDEVDAINAQVRELQARGVHAFVAVIHEGWYQPSYRGPTDPARPGPAADLARLVARLDADVDVVIGGHAHTFTNALLPNAGGRDVLCVQAFSAGMDYADVDLTLDPASGEVLTRTARIVPTYASAVTPAADALFLVTTAEAAVAPITARVVATAAAPLTRRANDAGESPLGDLVAEAHRAALGADVGFMNPGGLRADVPATCAPDGCPVTWSDCFTALPFGNAVVRVTLTGRQLHDLLEQQWPGCHGQTSTRMLGIAGLRYAWSSTATACGTRVVPGSLRRTDGTPIAPDARYTVAVNGYLARGGDRFTILEAGTSRTSGPGEVDALVTHLRALPQPVVARTDGRVERR